MEKLYYCYVMSVAIFYGYRHLLHILQARHLRQRRQQLHRMAWYRRRKFENN